MLFVISLLVLAGLAHALSGFISFLANKGGDNWFASDHALLLTALLFAMVGLGAFFRYLEIKHGGAALARHYGATPAPITRQSRQIRTLSHVVEEMALASRLPMPELWIMARERGINAFVAGNSREDLVLVVTQGALDVLDRDELQAVIGHEMGHIKNGDVPLNMQLLMVLSGLMAIDQIGQILTGNDAKNRFAPLAIVGLVLRGLGSAGVLCAGLIRAAFGRQREFLADASSVQFTRQSDGLAGALDRIHKHVDGSRLSGYYADEIAHLCFLSPVAGWKLKEILSVHPGIQERIKAVAPNFTGRHYRDRKPTKVLEPVRQNAGLETLAPVVLSTFDGGSSLDINTSGLPDELQIMISGNFASESMLFALLAQQFDGNPAIFLKAMSLKNKTSQAESVQKILNESADKIRKHTIDLIDHAGSSLRSSYSEEERQNLYELMEKFARLDRSHNFREFVLLELIAHKLGISGKFDAPAETWSFQEAAGLVLGLITEAGGHDEEQRNKRYARYACIYGATAFPLRSVSETDIVSSVKSALFILEDQMPAIRATFIRHCADIARDDGKITDDELLLLNLLSVTLNTPFPKLH